MGRIADSLRKAVNISLRSADFLIIVCLNNELKRNINTVLVLAFIAGLLFLFARPDYRQGEPSLRGTPEKDFPLILNGHATRLSDLKGKVVLLNFWATWCPPCVDEAPSLNALQKRIAPLGGTVLGVSVDDDEQAYQQFIKNYQLAFPTFRDTTKQIPLMYGTTMYPDTYIIDRQGKLDRKIVGPQDWSNPEMTQYLDKLLSAK